MSASLNRFFLVLLMKGNTLLQKTRIVSPETVKLSQKEKENLENKLLCI